MIKHVQGGIFDLNSIKATTDMKLKQDDAGSGLLVVEAPCAPSQKLKEDGKEAFNYVRLCFELNDRGKFVRVHNHPATACACPVGCIWCAHKGILLALCHAITSYTHFCLAAMVIALHLKVSYPTFQGLCMNSSRHLSL